MRKLPVALVAVMGIASATLVAACDDGLPPPTSPTPSGPSFVAVTITSGPGTLAPGQSGQYTASVRLSDGTVQTAAEAGVRWAPSDTRTLQVDQSGRVTALERLGDATLVALVGNPAVGQEKRGTMEITIVPEGTYRMVGAVTEAESASLGIPNARVEVTPGAFATSTDGNGRYKFYGVPADAHLRVTAEGYVPHERSLRLAGHATEDVPLTLSGPRLMVSGPYTLAIDVVSGCSTFRLDAHHRAYDAVVTQTGPVVAVTLTEPRFRVNEIGRGNRFTGRVVGTVAEFTFESFDVENFFPGPMDYPNVVERLPDGTFFVVDGIAVATASAGGLSGPLTGRLSGWGPGFPTTLSFLQNCGPATHRFTLTPR